MNGLILLAHRCSKLMLLPQQHFSIPVLAWLADKLLALLPRPIALPKAPSAPLLLFDPEHVMPAHPLTQLNQGQAAQSPIGQQSTLVTAEMGSHQLKQVANDFPLSLLPGFFLRHHAPRQWQDARLHQDAQIDNGCFFAIGCRIQDQGDRLVVPIR